MHVKWLSREVYYPTHDGPAQLPPAQRHSGGSTNLPATYPAGEAAVSGGRRYAGEITEAALDRGHAVAQVEHRDAASAVAAAAAAVAHANGLASDQPVIVVVAEDVPDWVDEDPGC
jgi:hypothetical protein